MAGDSRGGDGDEDSLGQCPACRRRVPAGAGEHAPCCPWGRQYPAAFPAALVEDVTLGPADPALVALLARFGRWLANQDVPARRRSQYQTQVEHYLRWQAAGPDPHADRTQRRYFSLLRRHGATDDDLGIVHTSLALLRRHLLTAGRKAWTRPESTTSRGSSPDTR
jgi:hypothetical protein